MNKSVGMRLIGVGVLTTFVSFGLILYGLVFGMILVVLGIVIDWMNPEGRP